MAVQLRPSPTWCRRSIRRSLACRARGCGCKSRRHRVSSNLVKRRGPPFRILSVCKGGGYRYCRTEPPHPHRNAKGLYPLHRVVLENKLGRLLKRWGKEIAHHEDENKTNDSPENIVLKTTEDHSRKHMLAIKAVADVRCECPVCETVFFVKPHLFRSRRKRNKTGEVYCSRKCGTVANHRRGVEQSRSSRAS